MNEKKYYICHHCGNMVDLICDGGAPVRCCGQNMELLVPGSQDASHEKHVPYVISDMTRLLCRSGRLPIR